MNARPVAMPRYRPMQGDDLDAVMGIENEIYTHPWTLGNFVDSLAAGYACWVAERGRRLVAYGVVMVGAGEAHLLNLSVCREAQGTGLGRSLLALFESRSRDLAARTMLLEVRRSNTRARDLYARAGFEEIAVRRHYYPAVGGREDAVLMGKEL